MSRFVVTELRNACYFETIKEEIRDRISMILKERLTSSQEIDKKTHENRIRNN